MNRSTCVGVGGSGGVQAMLGGVFVFIHRNARIALAIAIAAGAVGAASAIGWLTAPI